MERWKTRARRWEFSAAQRRLERRQKASDTASTTRDEAAIMSHKARTQTQHRDCRVGSPSTFAQNRERHAHARTEVAAVHGHRGEQDNLRRADPRALRLADAPRHGADSSWGTNGGTDLICRT